MFSVGAAPRAVPLSNARAEASRRNGARSCGPKTPEGKARSSHNALKHGLRAQKYVVLPGESATEFKALEAALIEELAPEGALQSALAQRIVAATWRLARAERLEAELFAENHLEGRNRAASTRSCAIVAARSPSFGARCAPSRRCRPSRRRVASPPWDPRRVSSPSRTKRRSNPRPAAILTDPSRRSTRANLRCSRAGRRPHPAR